MSNEDLYDNEIAPALQQIMDICAKVDMPFLAAVQFEGDHGKGVGKTFGVSSIEACTADMALVYVAMRAKGNLDALVMAAGKLPHAKGHDSIFLAMQNGGIHTVGRPSHPSAKELQQRIDDAIEASDNDGGSASDAIQDMLAILQPDE